MGINQEKIRDGQIAVTGGGSTWFKVILQVGEELIGVLEALDCKDTPKAREIQDTVDNVSAKFDQIQVPLLLFRRNYTRYSCHCALF